MGALQRPKMIFVTSNCLKISPAMIRMGLVWDLKSVPNKGPNLMRLHMGHLIEANITAWYDF